MPKNITKPWVKVKVAAILMTAMLVRFIGEADWVVAPLQASNYPNYLWTWTNTNPMSTARYAHTATHLPNGKVLAAGGYGNSALASAELYRSPSTARPFLLLLLGE